MVHIPQHLQLGTERRAGAQKSCPWTAAALGVQEHAVKLHRSLPLPQARIGCRPFIITKGNVACAFASECPASFQQTHVPNDIMFVNGCRLFTARLREGVPDGPGPQANAFVWTVNPRCIPGKLPFQVNPCVSKPRTESIETLLNGRVWNPVICSAVDCPGYCLSDHQQ